MTYRYDVFLSYSRAQRWPSFVTNHLRPILDHWLGSELGTDARIFHDVDDIAPGQNWPRRIEEALAGSRVMVALFSRNYFQSEWCRNELAAMMCRARRLQEHGLDDQVVFPLAIHDCHDESDLPAVVRPIQILRIHRYADPFMHPESALREDLSRALQPFCAQIARRVEQTDDATYLWPLADDTEFRNLLQLSPRVQTAIPMLGAAP
jgi:hypothetical protein